MGILRSGWPASELTRCWQTVEFIAGHTLNFLENHDEPRLASPLWYGDAFKALPALVVSATMTSGPFMFYAGQELGEPATDAEGYSGLDGRTTIFDYWSVPSLRRWHLGKPTSNERHLRALYRNILRLTASEPTLAQGQFYDLMYANQDTLDTRYHYAYLRHCDGQMTLVVANFGDHEADINVRVPQHALDCAKLPHGAYRCHEHLTGAETEAILSADTTLPVHVAPHNAVILTINC